MAVLALDTSGDIAVSLVGPGPGPTPPVLAARRVREQRRHAELLERAEPVGVDVHEVRPADGRRVHPGDDERRRGDLATHPQPGADALGERRLARPQRAAEHHEVTRAEHTGQPPPVRPGRLGVGQVQVHDAVVPGHAGAPAALPTSPTYRRGTRAPTRVTIS